MSFLLWVIVGLLFLIIVLLLVNQKFNLVGKYKEVRRDQVKYKQIHEKYKKLLDK